MTVDDVIKSLRGLPPETPFAVLAIAGAGTADERGYYLPVRSIGTAEMTDDEQRREFAVIAVEARAVSAAAACPG